MHNVPAHKQAPAITPEMNPLLAIQIIECDIECDDESRALDAWQHLIDTGIVWTLQGSYGRMAARLIESGACTA
jgi:hypothetical protein